MDNSEVYRKLIKETRYAVNSAINEGIHYEYGKVCMALELEAISYAQYMEFNDVLVKAWMNGGLAREAKSRKALEEKNAGPWKEDSNDD